MEALVYISVMFIVCLLVMLFYSSLIINSLFNVFCKTYIKFIGSCDLSIVIDNIKNKSVIDKKSFLEFNKTMKKKPRTEILFHKDIKISREIVFNNDKIVSINYSIYKGTEILSKLDSDNVSERSSEILFFSNINIVNKLFKYFCHLEFFYVDYEKIQDNFDNIQMILYFNNSLQDDVRFYKTLQNLDFGNTEIIKREGKEKDIEGELFIPFLNMRVIQPKEPSPPDSE